MGTLPGLPGSTRPRCARLPSGDGRCWRRARTRASSVCAALWRSRALVLLGRAAELTREQQLELRLEGRLAGLQDDIERARSAGDEEAAQAAHARYIELGTTFMRRFVLVGDGRPGTPG